jgi:hypothetical protein
MAVAERTSQGCNMNAEVPFFDESRRPDSFLQLLLADDLSVFLEEGEKNVTSPAANANGLVGIQKQLAAGKKGERTERNAQFRRNVIPIGHRPPS